MRIYILFRSLYLFVCLPLQFKFHLLIQGSSWITFSLRILEDERALQDAYRRKTIEGMRIMSRTAIAAPSAGILRRNVGVKLILTVAK